MPAEIHEPEAFNCWYAPLTFTRTPACEKYGDEVSKSYENTVPISSVSSPLGADEA